LTEWRGHSCGSVVWFSYFEGNLTVRKPDDECLAKMRQVAAKLQARVQGDEGEVYDGVDQINQAPRQASLSFGRRLAGWFARLRSRRLKIDHPPLPFSVGERVRDTWGNEHTVIAIDPSAEHGMGVIRTRRSDGTELGHMMIAHGLVPIVQKERP
jgi:hypothetical protein